MVILKKKLPDDVPTSQYLCDKAVCFAGVHLFGGIYWFPVTRMMKRLFGIVEHKGTLRAPLEGEQLLEEIGSTIVGSVYLQVRDTVGAEIEASIKRDVSEKFERLFSGSLHAAVERGMENGQVGMLPDPDSKGKVRP